MSLIQTSENPNQDVVTVAWSTVDIMAEALSESDPEIARLETKVLKAQAEILEAEQAMSDAQARKIVRQENLDAAISVLEQISADNPELAAEALARR